MNKVVKIVLIVVAVLAVLYGLLLAATHLTDQSYTDTRYDSDGNVIGKIKYSFEVKNLMIDKHVEYEFEYIPGTEQIIKAVDYVYRADSPLVLGSRCTYTFSEDFPARFDNYFTEYFPNLVKKDEIFDENGALLETLVCEYNADTFETKHTVYDADGKLTGYSVFEYNEKGSKTKELRYDGEGNLTGYTTREYNENQHLIKESSFDSQDRMIDCETYRYEFDDDGHVTKAETYDSEGNLKKYYICTSIDDETRKGSLIEYYDSEGNLVDSVFMGIEFEESNS